MVEWIETDKKLFKKIFYNEQFTLIKNEEYNSYKNGYKSLKRFVSFRLIIAFVLGILFISGLISNYLASCEANYTTNFFLFKSVQKTAKCNTLWMVFLFLILLN